MTHGKFVIHIITDQALNEKHSNVIAAIITFFDGYSRVAVSKNLCAFVSLSADPLVLIFDNHLMYQILVQY